MGEYTEFLRKQRMLDMEKEERKFERFNVRRERQKNAFIEFSAWFCALCILTALFSLAWMGLNRVEERWRTHEIKTVSAPR